MYEVFEEGGLKVLADEIFKKIKGQEFSRILIDTTANWNAKASLISSPGVIYIYSDHQKKNGRDVPGFKVGDGNAFLIDVPFSDVLYSEHIVDGSVNEFDSFGSVSVATGTSYKDVGAFQLLEGSYILKITGVFSANANGIRTLALGVDGTTVPGLQYYDRRPALSGLTTICHVIVPVQCIGSREFHIMASQTSGSTLTIQPRVIYMRI